MIFSKYFLERFLIINSYVQIRPLYCCACTCSFEKSFLCVLFLTRSFLCLSRSPPNVVITRDTPPVSVSGSATPMGSQPALHHRQVIAAPSQWPGLRGWPRHMTGTDWCIKRCPDMVSLSLLLGEACVAVYVGMMAVALSRLSSRQLLRLLKNMPDENVRDWFFPFYYEVTLFLDIPGVKHAQILSCLRSWRVEFLLAYSDIETCLWLQVFPRNSVHCTSKESAASVFCCPAFASAKRCILFYRFTSWSNFSSCSVWLYCSVFLCFGSNSSCGMQHLVVATDCLLMPSTVDQPVQWTLQLVATLVVVTVLEARTVVDQKVALGARRSLTCSCFQQCHWTNTSVKV